LYNESQNLLVAQPQDYLTAPACRVGEGCVGRAFMMGQACISTPSRRRATFELAAPILLHEAGEDRALGVLCVYRASDGAPFDDSDKTLLELFASQAAIVIENAQLLSLRMEKARRDGELQAAHGVQASLIPKHPPSLPGYQLASAWHPAREVSGDFYDFIPLAQNRLGIVIADVSDKGMAAALFMASARGILRASANLGGSAREIIERANRAIATDASGGMFVTVFFGILDPRTRHLSYVNAGHNNPLLCRMGSDSLMDLRGRNLALGIIADFQFTTGELDLCPLDLILFYTDGVTEATNAADELFGEARLQRLIFESCSESARHLIRKLNETVRAFTGAHPQSDDITVVALKVS
jgi:sigma-B regulation protein RsbU (phosphoserine phosphatase)